MPKILFLNRSFWPDTGATGQLLTELTEDLAFDYEVTVVCGPANTAPRRRWPLLHRESHGAVKIIRTFGAKLSKKTLRSRFGSLGRYFLMASIASICEPADLIVAETDPPLLGLLGALVKRVKGCRFVYYCQDLYPDVAEATHALRNSWLLALLRWCNKVAYRDADAIVVLGQDMANRIRSKGVSAERIEIIPNWIDITRVKPRPLRAPSIGSGRGDFVVMYAGNFGLSQNLESILETARLMRDDRRVRFVLIGDGASKTSLERKAKLFDLPNVEFIDHQPREAMHDALAAASLHLIPLAAGAAGCLVPSKVYGILAAGRPFVAMMDSEAEVARLAAEYEVGFVVPPGDHHALAMTIAQSMQNPTLLEEMGRRARTLAQQSYDRRLITQRFADLLEKVLQRGPRAHGSVAPEELRPSEMENMGPLSID